MSTGENQEAGAPGGVDKYSSAECAARVLHLHVLPKVVSMAIVTDPGAPVDDFKTAMETGWPTLWLPAEHNIQNELPGYDGLRSRQDTLNQIDRFVSPGRFQVVGFYDTDFTSEVSNDETSSVAGHVRDLVREQVRIRKANRYLGFLAIGPRRRSNYESAGRGAAAADAMSIFKLFEEWKIMTAEGQITTVLPTTSEEPRGADYSPQIAAEIEKLTKKKPEL